MLTHTATNLARSTRQMSDLRLALASGGRRLPKAHVDAIIQEVQTDPVTTGEDIMEKQPNSRMCFVCGIENPIGLKLKFYTDDEGRCIAWFPVLVRYTCACGPSAGRTGQPKPEHQGYPGQLHGGVISSLLDVPTQIPVHSGVLAV
jgi:hypothetical protein